MPRPVRQSVVLGCLLLAGSVAASACVGRDCRAIDAGFWFEPVTYESSRFGGAIGAQDIDTIAAVAQSELTKAFSGLGIRFSPRRDATYRVRVVQELRDMRLRRVAAIPAESRSVPGFGGLGAVSFSWLASAAVTYSPADADRSSLIEAVGRGIGRAAVHEFAHLLLPKASIDDPTNVDTYEYRSAARREQYFGVVRWGRAAPLLQERIRPCST